MEVYIHAFLTLALKATVVSSTPRRGPRDGVDSGNQENECPCRE